MGIADFIARWAASGGSEKSNSQLFLTELCVELGVVPPKPTTREVGADGYVFEREVRLQRGGRVTRGWIDLYKEDCFILESKQAQESKQNARKKKASGQPARETPQWNRLMDDAFGQALGYARSLPAPPPFLFACDVGYCFDVYASFDGGQYYPFPSPQKHRYYLKDLASHVGFLRTIWTAPYSLDPSKRAAKITREVAAHLAELARSLEGAHPPELIAKFLMRCLFTMFAEDVHLLPEALFTETLKKKWIPKPESFSGGIETLWHAMNEGKDFGAEGKLLQFNGGLFSEPIALPLTKAQLEILYEAAKCDWAGVEPSIFGTLLERALDPKERHRLGAHYTPREYVERLVRPTIEEPLREEWDLVKAQVRALVNAGGPRQMTTAKGLLKDFHKSLCQKRVLDPACGTGNFLYVALDLFKRIEGEVLDQLLKVGVKQGALDIQEFTVTPQQFLGLEVKPWAKEIAELVLWIGYLQWHFRTRGRVEPPLPVLKNYQNIECRDAVLAYDRREPLLEGGKPVTRWDGETYRKSPATGEDIPDDTARVSVYQYVNPRKAEWPQADFIVGNPPFIGNWRMRSALGEGYTEALRKTHEDVPETCDFVMYWWNQAARLMRAGKVRRFGLITTNSITQTFNRKVLQTHLEGKERLSLVFAVPDHPWVDSVDGAAVRISMTVAEQGEREGVLAKVLREAESEAREVARVELALIHGKIHANLSIGANVVAALALRANERLSCPGVKLHGAGFIVTPHEAEKLGWRQTEGLEKHIRPYLNGRDLAATSRGMMAIDLFGLEEKEVRERYPGIFQRLLERVKPERDQNNRASYRESWWIFGEPRGNFRPALVGLRRFIATVETSKHRFFVFLDAEVLPDNMLINFAIDDAFLLGVLSSRIHVVWALAAGGRLGIGNDPRYNKTRCFSPFPFLICTEAQQARIRDLGEALDAHRKKQQAQHPTLTLTGTYNVLEKLRAGEPLTDKEKIIHEQGLLSILKKLHDDLDAAVFDAYGWPRDLTDEQLLERLVALNAERVEEERRGVIRWLRPEYQNPKGKAAAAQTEIEEDQAEGATTAVPSAKSWPKKLPDQVVALRDLLRQGRAWTVQEVSKEFGGAPGGDVQAVLESLVALGLALAQSPEEDPSGKVGPIFLGAQQSPREQAA